MTTLTVLFGIAALILLILAALPTTRRYGIRLELLAAACLVAAWLFSLVRVSW